MCDDKTGMNNNVFYDRAYSSERVVFHWENAPGKKVIINALKHFLTERKRVPASSLVDIGCGTGFLLHRIRDLCTTPLKSSIKDLVGVDFSSAAINIGKRQYPFIEFLCEDGCNTSLPSESKDYLISYGTYEHFRDPKAGLKEASRLLKKGGVFLMMMPTLGIDRIDRTDEGWYEERKVNGSPIRQMQWNLKRETWESYFGETLVLYDLEFSTYFGAVKPGGFFFGYKR